MVHLSLCCQQWGLPEFAAAFKQEVAALGNAHLPLQQGLSGSSYARDDKLQVSIISAAEVEGCIRVKAGLFYTGIIAGCSCADDPTPIDEVTEYCEVQINIDKSTAIATISLLS